MAEYEGARARVMAPSTLLGLPASRGARNADSVRYLLFRTRLGRLFWLALAARLTVGWLDDRFPTSTPLAVLTLVVGLALGAAIAILVTRLWGIARRRLLWRVRRKLILSYVFIGVVPVVLLVSFFLFAGYLMSLHVSAFLFKRGFDDLVDEASVTAQTAAVEVQRMGLDRADEVIARKVANTASRYPGVSAALVPRPASARPLRVDVHADGPWRYEEPPTVVPDWVSVGGWGGLLAYSPQENGDDLQIVVRAVSFPDETDPAFAVIVDIPVDEQAQLWLRENTGITLTGVSLARGVDSDRAEPPRVRESAPSIRLAQGDATQRWAINTVTFFDFVDWASGRTGNLSVAVRVGVGDIYERLIAAQARVGRLSLGELFLLVLSVVGLLFLVIEIAALFMGAALARSITGAIHELFEGTQRVQRGDFGHRIAVRARDQLGELADSFNQMTASIEVLLRQAEEKRRLEEELRIAREIQMSLLPRGPLELPGVAISALCVPAREVGGDYYDFFPLDDQRVGIVIADVAGKGTSAALYMAELKGLLLSLSKIHESPKQLMVQANRVLADNLDNRSFITMTYAIVDLRRGLLTYARAGHTPLMHYRAAEDGRHTVDVLTPDGIVLGLRIEGVLQRFEQVLEERSLPLVPGDVFVFYTDGITEAMNPAADLFGEERLQQVVAAHGHLPPDDLREHIMTEVEEFVGPADQHDDMTMILVQVGQGFQGATTVGSQAGTTSA